MTISGSGFGTKDRAEALIFDDVEDGSFNPSWSHTTSLSPNGTESRHPYSDGCGTVNFKDYEEGGWFTGGSNDPGPWYCQYWFKLGDDWDWGTGAYGESGANLANVKIFRIWETGPSMEDFVMATEGWSGSVIYTASNISGQDSGWFESGFKQNWTKGTWHLFQFEFKDSSMGQHDGVIRMWRDGHLVLENTSLMTREDDSAYKRPYIVGFYNSWGESNTDDNHFYIDDAYIDNTWARVEIGNAPVYGNCNHREIQLPQDWSNDQIVIKVNQGSFPSDSPAYVFVKDRNGNVSDGFEIVMAQGNSSGPGRPGKPVF